MHSNTASKTEFRSQRQPLTSVLPPQSRELSAVCWFFAVLLRLSSLKLATIDNGMQTVSMPAPSAWTDRAVFLPGYCWSCTASKKAASTALCQQLPTHTTGASVCCHVTVILHTVFRASQRPLRTCLLLRAAQLAGTSNCEYKADVYDHQAMNACGTAYYQQQTGSCGELYTLGTAFVVFDGCSGCSVCCTFAFLSKNSG